METVEIFINIMVVAFVVAVGMHYLLRWIDGDL